jgi:hypothetical protein
VNPRQFPRPARPGSVLAPALAPPRLVAPRALALLRLLSLALPLALGTSSLAGCLDEAESCPRGAASCPGASELSWQLPDVQPVSPRYGQTYGLEAFRGRVTVLLMIDTLCGNCGPTAVKMDQMSRELRAEGHDIVVVGLLKPSVPGDVAAIVKDLSYPVFHDNAATDAWTQQGAGESDMFVYGPSGQLIDHLGVDSGRTVHVALPPGYTYVKATLAAIDDGARRGGGPGGGR